jgi:hypothetical protein
MSDSAEDFETHHRPDLPEPGGDRPDWLVGAEEGAHAERARDGGEPSSALRLVRPEAGTQEPTQEKKGKAKLEAWKAAASSVPTLRRAEEPAKRNVRNAPAPAWSRPEPVAESPTPTDAFAIDAPETTESGHGLPADELADPRTGAARQARRAVPLRPLDEPWWAVALDGVRSNRAIQLGALALLLGALAWFMWPRSEPTVSIGTIQQHPERFNGATVRVRGRVGDVYDVGGAYAYYLVQGRDTIVVFSRTRRPYRNEKLQVSGSISTGYLDGVARPSIFEVVQ